MDLKELRGQIDEIDDQLVSLFCRRMDIAAQVADYKKANGLPILVFDLGEPANIAKAVQGEVVGTLVKE